MRKMKISCFGPLFFSMLLLLISMISTRTTHAQAPAAGASVAVRVIEPIDSSKDPAGKQYRASVTKAVDAGNGVVIPQGATALVTLVNSGNGSGWTTQLVSVSINGQPVAVTSSPASMTSAAQNTASSAASAVGSMLGGFGHHASAPAGITAVAMGQRVVLPPGATLTFVLSQPPATSPASPGAPAAAAVSAPPAAQPGQPSAAPVAAAGQHWWMCHYKDLKDPYKPALGSRMYFALFPSSAPVPNPLNKRFNGYIQQNYKIVDKNNAGNGYCERYSDDATGRAFSMDMIQKQWASSSIEPVQVPWADTPAQDAAIDAKLAGAASAAATADATPTAAADQKYVWCHTAWAGVGDTPMPPGTVLYVSDVFAGTMPPPTGSGMHGADQRNQNYKFQAPFLAFLQEKYGYKEGGICSALEPPTLAGLRYTQMRKQEFEDQTRHSNGQVVETGWVGEGAPGQGAAASPAAAPTGPGH